MWLWLPLILAILAAFLKQTKAVIGLVTLTLVAAFFDDRVSILALISIIIGFAIAYQTPRLKPPLRSIGYSLVIIWALALSLHLIPGFSNLLVLDKVISGPESAAFTMYLNLDKPMVFFALLLAYPALLGKAKTLNIKSIAITSVALFTLLPIAAATGALKPEFSLPNWWWLFALNNLLLTCVVEEAFFRGFIQQTLSKRFGWIACLIVASVLFGLAHFAGGLLLVFFATLAGLGYGLIFHFTGRLWASVLAHFLFNFAHLVFFTYPILAK